MIGKFAGRVRQLECGWARARNTPRPPVATPSPLISLPPPPRHHNLQRTGDGRRIIVVTEEINFALVYPGRKEGGRVHGAKMGVDQSPEG